MEEVTDRSKTEGEYLPPPVAFTERVNEDSDPVAADRNADGTLIFLVDRSDYTWSDGRGNTVSSNSPIETSSWFQLDSRITPGDSGWKCLRVRNDDLGFRPERNDLMGKAASVQG